MNLSLDCLLLRYNIRRHSAVSVLSDSAAVNLGRRPSIAEVTAEPRRPSGDRRSSGGDSITRSVRSDENAKEINILL